MQENFDLKELMELLDTRQLRRLKEILMEMNEVDKKSHFQVAFLWVERRLTGRRCA